MAVSSQALALQLGQLQAQRDKYASAPLSSFAAGNPGDRFSTPEEARAATVAEYDRYIEEKQAQIRVSQEFESTGEGQRGAAEQAYFNEARARGVSVEAVRDQGSAQEQARATEYLAAQKARTPQFTPLSRDDAMRAANFQLRSGDVAIATYDIQPVNMSYLKPNISTPQGEAFALPYVPNMSLATNSKQEVGNSFYSITEVNQAKALRAQRGDNVGEAVLSGLTLASPYGPDYLSGKTSPSPESRGRDYKLQYIIETQRDIKQYGALAAPLAAAKSPLVQAGALGYGFGFAVGATAGIAVPKFASTFGGTLLKGLGVAAVASPFVLAGAAQNQVIAAGGSKQEQYRVAQSALFGGVSQLAAGFSSYGGGVKAGQSFAKVGKKVIVSETTQTSGFRPARDEYLIKSSNIVVPEGVAKNLPSGTLKYTNFPKVSTLSGKSKVPFTLGARLGARLGEPGYVADVPAPKGNALFTYKVGEKAPAYVRPQPYVANGEGFSIGTNRGAVFQRGRDLFPNTQSQINRYIYPQRMIAAQRPYGYSSKTPFSSQLAQGAGRNMRGQIKGSYNNEEFFFPLRRVTGARSTGARPTVKSVDRPFVQELKAQYSRLTRGPGQVSAGGSSFPRFKGGFGLGNDGPGGGGVTAGSQATGGDQRVGTLKQTQQMFRQQTATGERTLTVPKVETLQAPRASTSAGLVAGLLQLTNTRTQTRTQTRAQTVAITKPVAVVKPVGITLPKVAPLRQIQTPRTVTLPKTTNIPRATTRAVTFPTTVTIPNITPEITPIKPPREPPGPPGFPLVFPFGNLPGFSPSFNFAWGKGGKRQTKYTPTLLGIFSGKKIRKEPGLLTGLEIRYPLFSGKSTKRKRKR